MFEIFPVFVKEIPDVLQEGKIYISLEFECAIHLCACGCGEKSVTPIKENKWLLTNNNGLITLRPSIGNWSGENPNYHAHYYITNNKIEWL